MIDNPYKISIISMLQTWWKTKSVNMIELIKGNQAVAGLHLGLLALNERDLVNEALLKIFEMFRDGSIKPNVHSTWNFDNIVEATKLLAERRNIGKVLLELD